jgi:hypothetical protein
VRWAHTGIKRQRIRISAGWTEATRPFKPDDILTGFSGVECGGTSKCSKNWADFGRLSFSIFQSVNESELWVGDE